MNNYDLNDNKELKTYNNYTIYTKRWYILLLYCGLNMSNAAMWVTYAPISDLSQSYFDSNSFSGSLSAINMLATSYQIFYLPGSWLTAYLMKKYGFRYSVLIGGYLTTFGAFIRLFGAIFRNQLSGDGCYLLMLLGQSFAALAQPIFCNLPAAVASIWFAMNERDTATTISALFNPVGSAIGQIIPTLLVTNSNLNNGMLSLMGLEFALCFFPLILASIYLNDRPPTPPSHSTSLKVEMLTSMKSLQKELKIILTDRDYLLLFISFSIALALFNAFLTLLYQIVQPFGYSNNDVGIFGLLIILSGLIGAAVASHIMDTYHIYRSLLKVGFGMIVLFLVLLCCMLYHNNYALLIFCFALLGLFIFPLLPVAVENSAECTYPVPEELSTGLLFVGGNVLGIGFVFGLQVLLSTTDSNYHTPFLPSNFFIVGTVFLAWLIILPYNGKYKRLQCEKNNESSSLNESMLLNIENE